MRRPSRRVLAVTAGWLLAVGGCTKYVSKPVPTPPAPMRTIHEARVALSDGSEFYLTNVVIATDSLFGLTADVARLRIASPLSRVAVLQVKQRDGFRTVLALAAGLAVAGKLFGMY